MKINNLKIGTVNIQVNIINSSSGDAAQTTSVYDDTKEIQSDIVHVDKYTLGTNDQPEMNIRFEETLTMLSIALTFHKKDYERVYEGENGGDIGVITALRKWANEFEVKYLGLEWGIDENAPDWYDALDTFYNEKLSLYAPSDEKDFIIPTDDTDPVY